MNKSKFIITAFLSLCISYLSPQSYAKEQRVAPLGLKLGIDNLSVVRKKLDDKVSLQASGKNRYSLGPMLKTNGKGLGIDGLRNVTFIFSSSNILNGVIMNIDKNRFQDISNHLKEKYRLFDERNPFVGDRYLKFTSQNNIIEINAPHLSFQMEVTYLTKDLKIKFNRKSEQEKKEKKANEKSLF